MVMWKVPPAHAHITHECIRSHSIKIYKHTYINNNTFQVFVPQFGVYPCHTNGIYSPYYLLHGQSKRRQLGDKRNIETTVCIHIYICVYRRDLYLKCFWINNTNNFVEKTHPEERRKNTLTQMGRGTKTVFLCIYTCAYNWWS